MRFEAMATQERPWDDDQPYLERFVWGWAGRTCCGLFIYVLGVGWEIHELKSADSKNKSADWFLNQRMQKQISGFKTLTKPSSFWHFQISVFRYHRFLNDSESFSNCFETLIGISSLCTCCSWLDNPHPTPPCLPGSCWGVVPFFSAMHVNTIIATVVT